MLNNAGITDPQKALALNGINAALCSIGAILGARMTYVGRCCFTLSSLRRAASLT